MADGLDISFLTGKAKEIAIEVDSKNVKDNKLSEQEISIFLAECDKKGIEVSKESWYSKCLDLLQKNLKISKDVQTQILLPEQDVAVRDATYVAPALEVSLMKQDEAKKSEAKKTDTSPLPKPFKLGARSNIRTNYAWSEEEFEKVIDQMLNDPKYKNSVLRGKAKAFIQSGKKFNIDPRILVAISMCESARGTSAKALDLNNIGGLKINRKYHHFKTIEASIDSIAKTVNSRYNEGFTTLSKIAYSGKYCAPDAKIAAQWLSNISSYINSFNKYYKDEN